MKANELRIGNITDKGEVVTFWESGIHVGAGKCYGFIELKGIPLSEEILLKCGYKLVNTTNHYKSFEGKPYLYLLNNGNVKMSTGIEMKYFHELQNRIFSLTGQELNTSGLLK